MFGAPRVFRAPLQTSSSLIVQRSDSSGHFPLARAFYGLRSGVRRRLRLLREIYRGDYGGGDARFVAVILRRVFGFLPFDESGDITCINLASRELIVVQNR